MPRVEKSLIERVACSLIPAVAVLGFQFRSCFAHLLRQLLANHSICIFCLQLLVRLPHFAIYLASSGIYDEVEAEAFERMAAIDASHPRLFAARGLYSGVFLVAALQFGCVGR